MLRKYLGITSLLATSLVGFGVAIETQAATYDAGVLSTTEYTNTVFYAGTGVSFSDTYNFVVSPGTLGGYGAVNLPVDDLFNLSNLALSIYDTSNALVQTGLSFSGLTAGAYHAVVSGITSGPFGGAYTFYAGAVGAVPEPETWGMIGVGIAMIGYQARRRKNKQFIPSKLV